MFTLRNKKVISGVKIKHILSEIIINVFSADILFTLELGLGLEGGVSQIGASAL